ncbi:MAG: phosphoribosylglycinamide formyltransferase [Actinobacteria bacterium]|nr:phosphoribosylglycinamide formyltransferase [Actinomycetota bacterium]
MTNIAVFASGYGSNLQALIDYQKKHGFGNGKIVLVFSNNADSFALERAKKHEIDAKTFNPQSYGSRKEYDNAIDFMLEQNRIDLIVLAGYMLLLGPTLINKYKNRIINIHPALLPSFKGTRGIKDAFDYGVKVTGVTVHFVDEGLDSGPIILQEAVIVEQGQTIEEIEENIHAAEHKIYPLAVKYFCEGRILLKGRKVFIKK